ncbi:hypothetical protein N7490_005232 [Penicillium lividum]|nr:hypothetical protein N7490_005232 [Penicillium lividum]
MEPSDQEADTAYSNPSHGEPSPDLAHRGWQLGLEHSAPRLGEVSPRFVSVDLDPVVLISPGPG